MESLAKVFVSIVTIASSLAPQANLPVVLGVEETKTEESASSSSSPETIKTNRQLKERMEKARLEYKEKKEDFREKKQDEREEFKKSLVGIRDQKKARVIENIDGRLSTLNAKWVDHWNKVLERLTTILEKLKVRTETAKANGRDVTSVEEAISKAELAISEAQQAVNSQSQMTYQIVIDEEAGIGEEVKTVINEFHNDVKNTKDKVKEAKEAVQEVFKVLSRIIGEKEENETEE